MATKIEWTDVTWNPITGCTPISEGCKNCYAARMANRLNGRFGYPLARPFRVIFHPDKLDRPLGWRKPRHVFVCSMGDLFHEDVLFEWVDAVFGVMARCRQHTFQVLTKRPGRMLEWFQHSVVGPPSNVWFGVTCEKQDHLGRVEQLLELKRRYPHITTFVSAEPLLGPLDLLDYLMEYEDNDVTGGDYFRCVGYTLLDWVIVGGETGPGARAMHPGWVGDIRDQCQAADVPFFFKSWGKCKKAVGRLLDGRTHDGMPDARSDK